MPRPTRVEIPLAEQARMRAELRLDTMLYRQSAASFLTLETICLGVIVSPEGNLWDSFCPVARIFT